MQTKSHTHKHTERENREGKHKMRKGEIEDN